MKDVIVSPEVKVQFAGHETFPLRLLWLKKVHDAIAQGRATRRTFQEQEAIATFGVGRNMALSMRHWAVASGMILDDADGFRPSALASQILDEDGADPYLEDPATLWLVHLTLAGKPEMASTFFYAFNLMNQSVFDRETLTRHVLELAGEKGSRATGETIKRDVEVFLRSYVGRSDAGEDGAEPLLAELGLIRDTRLGGQYEFVRGAKPTLPDGIFAVALLRFWHRWHGDAPMLSVEQVTYAPGSPGRVFKLDEEGVALRLSRLADVTSGRIGWTDTAGLRQAVLLGELDEKSLISASYNRAGRP